MLQHIGRKQRRAADERERGAYRCIRAHHLSSLIGCCTHLTHAVNSGLSGPLRLWENMPST